MMPQPQPIRFLRAWYNGTDVLHRWWLGSGIRLHLAFYALFFGLLGCSLLLQADRWVIGSRSFGFLLRVIPGATPHTGAYSWGAVAVAVATIKVVAAIRYPRLAVAAITLGSVIAAVWALVFFIAYVASPPDAPPFAALFSAAVLFAHLRALAQLDLKRGGDSATQVSAHDPPAQP